MDQRYCDVAIIGAGPSGAIAASRLTALGWNVEVFESQHFPRFSIGESLLPICVEFLRETDMLADVEAQNFQFKDGAVFWMDGETETIDFHEKSAPGPATVWQVRRDKFDDTLIKCAMRQGAHVHFGHKVTGFTQNTGGVTLEIENEAGESQVVNTSFVLDASGFGRVLPRLMDLDVPSDQSLRRSCFKHVHDFADHPDFDRNKILITVHPDDPQVWLWLIPLADGMSSIGVVGADDVIQSRGSTPEEMLAAWCETSGFMSDILSKATEARAASQIIGFSRNVKNLYGDNYALLGNAAEFLDPVFSSGVTIAMKSAMLATDLVDRQLKGLPADWEKDFSAELKVGVNAFRACVNAWYTGLLQRLIFMDSRNEDISRHFTSILAGYAWDRKNPIVQDPKRFFSLMDRMTSD
ncbi:NAD(P)/FAD-dependent oxidoreductase [Henriciella litoralis]|uniref:NAD(P)/FAD-dependent oxidoreductase n=1 Tax=Henriciella litoralis TaxID=568102 RepID=UPI000A0091B8|nr:NAD(P)/FAD-dependent oxidoreductase [Henriciella litoralis]